MEKDSSVHDSDSDDSPADASNSQDSQTLTDAEKLHKAFMRDEIALLVKRQEYLKYCLKELLGSDETHNQAISLIENILSDNRNPDFMSKDRNVPEVDFQNISDDVSVNAGYSDIFLPSVESLTWQGLPESTSATELSEQPEVIPSETRHDSQCYPSPVNSLNDISEVSEDKQANYTTPTGSLSSDNLPTDPWLENETIETKTYFDLKPVELQSTDGLFRTPETVNRSDLIESGSSSGGKGKEAANVKFRYRKKPKSQSSLSESSDSKTPVKDSKIPFGTPDFKKLVLESPTAQLSDGSPAEKSGLHSSEKEDKRQSDENCAVVGLKSPRSCMDVDSQVVKKLKFENEKSSDSSPLSVAALLQHTEQYADNNIVMSKFIDQLQAHQFPKEESEELILPSMVDVSNVIVSKFSGTEDSRSRGSSLDKTIEYDPFLDESVETCIENECYDSSLGERKGSTFVNLEDDLALSTDEECTNAEAS